MEVEEVKPCSIEALKRHREQYPEGSESIYVFHTHNYFQPDDPLEIEIGRQFCRDLTEKFKGNPDVEVHGFYETAIGPHTWGNFEVLFTRRAFTDVITWSMLNRPDSMNILCHPMSGRFQAPDHGRNAFWLGNQIPVKMVIIEMMDEMVRDERGDWPTEKIMWQQAVHVGKQPADKDVLALMAKAAQLGLDKSPQELGTVADTK